jgi:hypothetical protein
MVDITDQLAPFLIQKEIDRLKRSTGFNYRYKGIGKFERVLEPVRSENNNSTIDGNELLNERIDSQQSQQITGSQIANATVSSVHLTTVEETWDSSKIEETKKIAQKKLNSKQKDLPRKIDL